MAAAAEITENSEGTSRTVNPEIPLIQSSCSDSLSYVGQEGDEQDREGERNVNDQSDMSIDLNDIPQEFFAIDNIRRDSLTSKNVTINANSTKAEKARS